MGGDARRGLLGSGMKIAIFGLTVSSSWGNGHATLWRGLIRALTRRGHQVVFFEQDVPYYANARDVLALPAPSQLLLYSDWASVRSRATEVLRDADLAIVTSYCPDAQSATDAVLDAPRPRKAFYDLDTPITLATLEDGRPVPYLPRQGLGAFDFVLSFTGGGAIGALRSHLGARRVETLYGHVDPDTHHEVSTRPGYLSDLSYLGTYASDRQRALECLFIEPARQRPHKRFVIGGAQYPSDFPWTDNVFFVRHLPPIEHAAFFSSSRLTLNITRSAMAARGYCPSGRLFEAAACGTPVLTDAWEGLDLFFTPGREVLLARHGDDVLDALERSDEDLIRIGRSARERVLDEHTSLHRAIELERIVERAHHSETPSQAEGGATWGIVPAAGLGSRIQPLAFSKELLPVGSRLDGPTERPRAVSEYLLDRMVAAGASKVCFVIAPGKGDILGYFGASLNGADFCYVVQESPAGLCDALFRAAPFIQPKDHVLVGLPDTLWFPENGLAKLANNDLSFLLFPVADPSAFDVVITNDDDSIREIQVKPTDPSGNWVWGAFKSPGHVFHELHDLWQARGRQDEFVGTLVNAYLARGGRAIGVRGGEAYVDVGTLNGFREASRLLLGRVPPSASASSRPAYERRFSAPSGPPTTPTFAMSLETKT